MVMRKFLSLTNLAKAQALYIHELSKVIVVRENKNLVFAAF